GSLRQYGCNGGGENACGGQNDQIGTEPVIRLLQQALEELRSGLPLLGAVFNPVAVHREHGHFRAGRERDDYQQKEQRTEQGGRRGIIQGSVPHLRGPPDYNRRPPFTFIEAGIPCSTISLHAFPAPSKPFGGGAGSRRTTSARPCARCGWRCWRQTLRCR